MLQRDDGIIVTIGDESDNDSSLKDCSLVTATYHVDGQIDRKDYCNWTDTYELQRGLLLTHRYLTENTQ